MPNGEQTFAVYFSHSWRSRDVDLNLVVWRELAGACELLVDLPKEDNEDPPYYINRIEERQRRSDLFVCVLTRRDTPAGGEAVEAEADSGDAALLCSAYSLFEIRLAERADLPKLVLYERSTRFKPPPPGTAFEAYIPFDRDQHDLLPDKKQIRDIIQPKIQAWLESAIKRLKPNRYEPPNTALMLLPGDAPANVRSLLKQCLEEAGYETVDVDPGSSDNTRAFRLLRRRQAGLVVADLKAIEDPAALQIYAAAHARFIPAIRTLRYSVARPLVEEIELPWILQGHPGGYQRDIVSWKHAQEFSMQVTPRALAMFDISRALGAEEAARHFQSKRYAAFSIFVSHTLQPPDRLLVSHIFELFKQQQVKCFEYHQVNTAGVDWKEELQRELAKTTHFIALLSEGYDSSVMCIYELEAVLARRDQVAIFPFFINGRTKPQPKLTGLHHRLLDSADQRVNAAEVVREVMAELQRSAGIAS